MNVRQILRYVSALMTGAVMATSCTTAWAAQVEISSTEPDNGISSIYSATFDAPINPVGDPFFGGTPPTIRNITITPNPTGILKNAVPCGLGNGPAPCIAPPQAGSFLDLTLSNNNTTLTIAGGNIAFPALTLNILGTTDIAAVGAGIVFDTTPQQTTVDANGIAVFEVDLAPAIATDFSTFSVIIGPGDCTGPLCGLVSILTLDMIRYRLTVDYDPTFSSFTADFIGQTANNSMVFATLNSGVPDITVTDAIAPADDLQMPFGSVTQLTSSADQPITITNDGTADLTIGTITPPATIFSIPADNCSGQTLVPTDSCTLSVRFSPLTPGTFNDSLDIPSNDPDENPVTIGLSGIGLAAPVPDIAVTDSVLPGSDLQIPFGTVVEGNTSDQTVTVANGGTADLIIGVITPPVTVFSIPVDNCSGQTLVPAATPCTLTVRFAPTTSGTFSDSLDIPSNDSDENPVTVSVSGTGIPTPVPDITVLDSIVPEDDLQIPFGDIITPRISDVIITVVNDGNADMLMGMIGENDPLADPFSILTDNCSTTTLAPSDSCIITVRMRPTSIAHFNDSLDIPSNDPDEPSVTVNLTGRGVIDPVDDIEDIDSGVFGVSSVDPGMLLAVLLLVIGVRVRRSGDSSL